MEQQQDQQPTSSATARPQQPADCFVASLPAETLAQIVDSSLQELDAWERQQARMSFAQVSIDWYGAAGVGRELAVKDTLMAGRLTMWLRTRGPGAERRARVRSLSMYIESDGAWRSSNAGRLLSVCRQLKSLELRAEGQLCLGADGIISFGKPLNEALKKLPQLRRFRYQTLAFALVPSHEILSAFASWPKLQTLTLKNVLLARLRDDEEPAPLSPLPLTRLEIPLSEVALLLAPAPNTLRHLHFTSAPIPRNSSTQAEGSNHPLASVTAIAPQLLSLVAVAKRKGDMSHHPELTDYWWPTLCALRDVRELRIGVIGYKLDAILTLLRPLKHLASLSISDPRQIWYDISPPLRLLTSAATLDFIDEAPALQNLTLPHQLGNVWTKEELARVETAAKQKGVRFILG
ncbi:hypothetical protein BCR35DRAFT_62404 [Leucosporidium creatinivorum]|uniref:F-box domain-containing protein n=1 Tax=Leucosporidium creatinivorum TaxID=106004 RepID=A0A1Y2FJP5_9BASI|nr:hypothetical protein BCR35DRAFT_62404 [Leucosporidium creatinivorum]